MVNAVKSNHAKPEIAKPVLKALVFSCAGLNKKECIKMSKLRVGEQVEVSVIKYNGRSVKIKKGVVLWLCDRFALIQLKNYRECFDYKYIKKICE